MWPANRCRARMRGRVEKALSTRRCPLVLHITVGIMRQRNCLDPCTVLSVHLHCVEEPARYRPSERRCTFEYMAFTGLCGATCMWPLRSLQLCVSSEACVLHVGMLVTLVRLFAWGVMWLMHGSHGENELALFRCRQHPAAGTGQRQYSHYTTDSTHTTLLTMLPLYN